MSTNRPAASGRSYWIQVGAFQESRNGAGFAKTLRSEGFHAAEAETSATRREARQKVTKR